MKTPKRLTLGMPVYREVDFESARTLVDFCLEKDREIAGEPWTSSVAMMRGQPVSLVREKIAREALFAADAEVLVFLDSDVALEPPSPVWRLLEHLLAIPADVGLLGVAVPMQQQGPQQLNVHPIVDSPPPPMPQPAYPTNASGVDPAHPYMEAAAIGFGCVAIRRDAFLALDRPWFQFGTDPEDENRFRGEDIWFCDRIREAGFRVLVDFSVKGSHWYRTEHQGAAPFAPPSTQPIREERA